MIEPKQSTFIFLILPYPEKLDNANFVLYK